MTDVTPSAQQQSQTGLVRTDINCHHCNKTFIAELDYDIDGQHIIECPYCAHEHYRFIQKGFVSDQRWGSDNDNKVRVEGRRVWKHNVVKMKTSCAAEFLRNRWLNFNR